MQDRVMRKLAEVNKELWLVLSLFVIAAILNFAVTSHRMVLGFYTLPTLFSAYFYGRRHATLTAFASAFMVGLITFWNPNLFSDQVPVADEKWFDLVVWGGMLVVTGYAMGTLYDNKEKHLTELRATYHGVLMILCQFVSKDKYTQNHSHRVAIYAARIASYLGLNSEQIEDIRAAALLHDIGKLDVSRNILYKAARLSDEEFDEMRSHTRKGADLLQHVGGSLRRIIPIVLAHHDKFDGGAANATQEGEIPLEARVISVADVYDALTSDRPYRKAMSPYEAKQVIEKGSGTEFDPKVVEAFLLAFRRNEMEIPELMVVQPLESMNPAVV